MSNNIEQIDWDRVCLTSPVGPYAEPVATLSPVNFGKSKPVMRRSHLRTFRVVQWGELSAHKTTYAAIAEFTGFSSNRSEVELTKFVTMPSQADEYIIDGRVSYDGWSWKPEIFDAVSRLERRLVNRSLDILNDHDNPGWQALMEATLCEVVPFAFRYPAREYVELLITCLDGLANFWARVLRLKWYLGQGQCIAMLDPSNIEYPKYHPINLNQVEKEIEEHGQPIVIASAFALSLRRPSMDAQVCKERQNGHLVELVPIEDNDLTKQTDAMPLDFRTFEMPVDYGKCTKILSGGSDSSELIDKVPVTVLDCDNEFTDWLKPYTKDVIGQTPADRRKKFNDNFPEIGSFSKLDDIASLSTLRYLRRNDFPSEYDWLAFVASEVFEHQFGAISMLNDMRRYVFGGLQQLAFSSKSDFDPYGSDATLTLLDPAQRDLAVCHLKNGEIELLLQQVVVSMLKHKFGADGLYWYDKGVPKTVQDRVKEKWAVGSKLPPERCFDLLNYKTIMKHNWCLFYILFAEKEASKPNVNKSLRWIGSLNQLRLDLAHPSRRGSKWMETETGISAPNKLSEWLELTKKLKKRCDAHLG